MDIKKQLLDFIILNYLVEEDEIPLDESLVDTGVIDSVGLIEIASFIEENFGFTIKENHMNRDNFGSVNKIVEFIKRESPHETTI